jgi:ABC-2 type transport system permease protein
MNFLDILKGEAKLVFSDIAIVLTIIGGVILYSFLYPQPYLKQSVVELPVSIVDLDKSDTSKKLSFYIDATPQISVVRYDSSKKDALESIISTEVKGVIVIPPNFKRDLSLALSPTVLVGVDNSYFLIFGSILEGSMKSVLTQSAGIKVASLLKKSLPLESATKEFTPYSLNEINLFNKNNSYTQYVIPAVFVLILQQTLLIGLGILGGSVNEKRNIGVRGYYDNAKAWQIILSRVVIFGSIFFIHILFYFGFSFSLFGITHLANIQNLLAFSVIFLFAVLALGIFLSTLFNSREIATPLVLFSSLPLVFSVGFIWPIEAIPDFIRYISYLFPSTPAISGFLELNQMGADLIDIKKSIYILTIQIFLYGGLAYFVIQKKSH